MQQILTFVTGIYNLLQRQSLWKLQNLLPQEDHWLLSDHHLHMPRQPVKITVIPHVINFILKEILICERLHATMQISILRITGTQISCYKKNKKLVTIAVNALSILRLHKLSSFYPIALSHLAEASDRYPLHLHLQTKKFELKIVIDQDHIFL